MTPSDSNASLPDASGRRPEPLRSLTSLLAPLRAILQQARSGWTLQLDPSGHPDVIEPWMSLWTHDEMRTLLLPKTPGAGASAGGSGLVLDRNALREYTSRHGLDSTPVVLIDGPVDDGDERAIRAALTARSCPLSAELRAVAAMTIADNRALTLQTRQRDHALRFVAESVRHYLAALRGVAPGQCPLPEMGLVDRIMDRSGRMSIRPIETEIYSTTIDIGVSTASNGVIRPADTSLIFDVYTNAWYGD